MRQARRTKTVVVLSERGRVSALAERARDIAAVMGARVRELAIHPGVGRPDGNGAQLAAVRQGLADARPEMIVGGWPDASFEAQQALALAARLRLPGVFLRWKPEERVERVLIPTNGGPHTLQQMWVAGVLAKAAAAPQLALRVLTRGVGDAAPESEAETARLAKDLAAAQARMSRLDCAVETRYAPDPVTGIEEAARPTDLVVLGAPNSWRVAEHFGGSLPDAVARRVKAPMAMLLARRTPGIRLRDVFWQQTILPGLAPRNKEELLASLVDTLVNQGQAPAPWRDHLVERALAREAEQPTLAGHDTAFPHITVPDFTGVVGCMGICPQGVAFGSDGETAKFVFLLITPESFYEGYMTLMASIARIMIRPEARRRLLLCDGPLEVMEALDDLEAAETL